MITFGKITMSNEGNIILNFFQTPTQSDVDVIHSPKFAMPLCEEGEDAFCRLAVDHKQNKLKIKNVTRELDKLF